MTKKFQSITKYVGIAGTALMLAIVPFAVYAQNAEVLVQKSQRLVNQIIPLLISLAVLAFIYGVIRYVIIAKDGEGKKKAKDFMLWSMVGLFLIVAVWGIIEIIRATIGVNTNVRPNTPCIDNYDAGIFCQ